MYLRVTFLAILIYINFFVLISCKNTNERPKKSTNHINITYIENPKYSYLYQGSISLKDLIRIRGILNKHYIDSSLINISAGYASGLRSAFDLLNIEYFPAEFFEKYKNEYSFQSLGSKLQSKSKRYILVQKKQYAGKLSFPDKIMRERKIYDSNLNIDQTEFEEELDYIYQTGIKKYSIEESQKSEFKNKLLFVAIKGFLESLDNLTTIFPKQKIQGKDVSFENSLKDKKNSHRIIGKKNKLLYIRVKEFNSSNISLAADEYAEKILNEMLVKSGFHDKSIIGIVIDLRDNEGGNLSIIENFLKLFSSRGLLFSIQNDLRSPDELYNTGDKKIDLPIAIMVNEKTSAGAEIIAGSLKENRRAIIVGVKTAGRGTIQRLLELPENNNYFLKITTNRVILPSGNEIQEHGIEPDILIDQYSQSIPENPDRSNWNALKAKRIFKRQISNVDLIGLNLIRDQKIKNKEYDFMSQEESEDLFFTDSIQYFFAYLELKK